VKQAIESEFETACAVGERLIQLGGVDFAKSHHGQAWFAELVSRLRGGRLVIIKRVLYHGELASITLRDDL
jgi:predicted O-methyltransferase YrrM